MKASKLDRVRVGPLATVLKMYAVASEVERVAIMLGVIEGSEARVYSLYEVENLKGSPVKFEADPWQVVQASKTAEKYGLEIVGVFHTHTSCPASPSPKDLEGMKAWPYVWIIACKDEVRAWVPSEGSAREIPLEE